MGLRYTETTLAPYRTEYTGMILVKEVLGWEWNGNGGRMEGKGLEKFGEYNEKSLNFFFSVVFDDFANHQIWLSLKRFPPNPLPKEVEGSSNSLFGY